MITEPERRQRLQDIEEMLLSLGRKRALLDDVKNNPDVTYGRAEIDTDIARLRAEHQLLQEPGQLIIWDRVNDMWKIVLDMQADDRVYRQQMHWWMAAVSVAVLLVLAVELVRL